MRFISLTLLSVLIVIASANSYDGILESLLNGKNDEPSGGAGTIVVNSNEPGNDGSRFIPSLKFVTLDNYDKLVSVTSALSLATEHQMLGDQVYLYNYIRHKGDAATMKLTNDSKFTRFLCDFYGSIINIASAKFAETSTRPELAAYYRQLKCFT
ncbi:hypothetical protein CAAN1_26S00562 [[Candida] anglica]|uniref:WD-like domain-containing protein n=1 Tax=[Candida] anglica TaxID=148631 RepID=A0ABP0EHH1_9ASCO